MRRILRGTRGPHTHAVFVIAKRVSFGRAQHTDVQLVDSHVSRQHARLTIRPDGTALLCDLASQNGTWVAGEKITQHILSPGDRFQIGTSEYAYEEAVHGDVATSQKFGDRVTSQQTLARTAQFHLDGLEAPAEVPIPGSMRPTPRETPTLDADAAPAPHRHGTAEYPRPPLASPSHKDPSRLPSEIPSAPRAPTLLTPSELARIADPAALEISRSLLPPSSGDTVPPPGYGIPSPPAFSSGGSQAPPTTERLQTELTALDDDPAPASRTDPREDAHPTDRRVDARVHRAIDTVLQFRTLMTRESCGEPLRLDERERLRKLEHLLRTAGVLRLHENRRRWVRIPVDLPGEASDFTGHLPRHIYGDDREY